MSRVDQLIIAPLLCFLDMLNASLSLCSFVVPLSYFADISFVSLRLNQEVYYIEDVHSLMTLAFPTLFSLIYL